MAQVECFRKRGHTMCDRRKKGQPMKSIIESVCVCAHNSQCLVRVTQSREIGPFDKKAGKLRGHKKR